VLLRQLLLWLLSLLLGLDLVLLRLWPSPLLLWPSPLLLWPSPLLLQASVRQLQPLHAHAVHVGVLLRRAQQHATVLHTLLMCWAADRAGDACARTSQRSLS
jgi:hypothetical protein